MILFQEDWKKFPTAFPDISTTNESWVKLAALLKSMGVTNYYFMLALYQPILKGVDPYSENLSEEIKMAIALEIQYNPWYFFREVVRIPNGKSPLMFNAHRGNISVIWSFLVNIDYAFIIPRQNGKSTTVDCIDIYLLFFKLFGAEIFLLTKDNTLRKRNIRRLKETRDLLPKWLCPHNPKKDENNVESITCVARGNRLSSAVGQMQVAQAENVGVGSTFYVTNIDESPKTPNIHITLPFFLACTTTARDNAEREGYPYGNLFTCTSGKKSTQEGSYMYTYLYNSMVWDECLYDCKNRKDAIEMVCRNSKDGSRKIIGVFNHRQVGRTDEWLKEKRKLVGGSRETFEMDYLNKWSSGTLTSPIDSQVLESIKLSEKDHVYTQVNNDSYILRWYIPEHLIAEFMYSNDTTITLDSGEAVGRDYNAITVLNDADCSLIAASGINEANTTKYALWLADLLIMFPRMTLIFENKSTGGAIVDTIVIKLVSKGIDPFKRIYNKIVDHYLEYKDEYEYISKHMAFRSEETYVKYKSLFGFKTNGSNRQFLYDTVLTEALKSSGHLIKDKVLIEELSGLIEKNGRVDHLAGGHDDMVISYLLGHYFLKHTKNLKYYGIDISNLLSLVTPNGAIMTDEEMLNRRKLLFLQQEIQELKEKLTVASNIIESTIYEKQLTLKVKEANELGDISLSIDKVLEEIKDKAVSKNNLRQSILKTTQDLRQRNNYGYRG